MTWKGDLAAQVRAEFAAAQEMRRGVVKRVSDEREPVRPAPVVLSTKVEERVRPKRRIVTIGGCGKGATAQ